MPSHFGDSYRTEATGHNLSNITGVRGTITQSGYGFVEKTAQKAIKQYLPGLHIGRQNFEKLECYLLLDDIRVKGADVDSVEVSPGEDSSSLSISL